MTRQELAEQLDRDADSGDFGFGEAVAPFRAAAAELRKSCAGCEHFNAPEFRSSAWCERIKIAGGIYRMEVPRDGLGHCHNWKAGSQ